MSRDVQLIEGWLWKAKRGMTTTWKKHFVRADNEHFYQWTGTSKPTRDDEPKYTLALHQCKVRTSTLRKFAFEIVEHGGKPMTFAADDSVSFKKWTKILGDKTEAAARLRAMQSTVLGGNNPASLVSSIDHDDQQSVISSLAPPDVDGGLQGDETRTQEEQVLLQHLMDGAQSFGEGRINLDTIRAAIRAADPRLQEDRVVALLRKATVVTADGKVSVHDFRRFWRAHAALLMPTERGAVTAPFSLAPPAIDALSSLRSSALSDDVFLNGAEELLEEVLTPLMLRAEVPLLALEDAASETPTAALDVSQLTTPAAWYAAQAQLDGRVAELQRGVDAFLTQRGAQPSDDERATRAQWHRQLVVAYEEQQLLWEHFYEVALSAAQRVADECVLPAALQTLPPAAVEHATLPAAMGALDTYVVDGVHLQLLWRPVDAAEALDDARQAAALSQLEETLGRLAATELREAEYLNDTLDELLLADRADLRHRKRAQPSRGARDEDDDDDADAVPHFATRLALRRCFRTVVDCTGLRFVAFVPTGDLAQELALDEDDAASGGSDADERRSAQSQLLEELGAALNIRHAADAVYLLEWRDAAPPALDEGDAAAATAPRRYVHATADQLLPADLCRPHTHDALVRRLRPEFVRMFRLQRHRDATRKARDWTRACRHYYAQHLPLVAALLDGFQLQPADSASLTQTLHTHGVNLRHLGVLFSLCRQPAVRQLLFAELFARAVKRLYRDMVSRLAKAERLRVVHAHNVHARDASQRGVESAASPAVQAPDFRSDAVDAFRARRQRLLLTVVNRILRRHHVERLPGEKSAEEMEENSHKFFRCLFGVLQQKFGLALRSPHDLDHCPWHPQLALLALQRHLQVRFKDDVFAGLDADRFVSARPLGVVDVVDFCLPTHRRGRAAAGDLAHLLRHRHRFLSLDLLPEATALHRLELRLARLTAPGAAPRPPSWPRLQRVAQATYHALVCLLLQRRHAEALRLASQHLSSAVTCQHGAAAGRVLAAAVAAAYHGGQHASRCTSSTAPCSCCSARCRRTTRRWPCRWSRSPTATWRTSAPSPTRLAALTALTALAAPAAPATAAQRRAQAKWLLQMAWAAVSDAPPAAAAAAAAVVGPPRLAFALQFRLAHLLVLLGDDREAMPHYHALLRTIDQQQQRRQREALQAAGGDEAAAAVAAAAAFFREKVACLYHLCLAHYHCEELDLALQFGQQALQTAAFGEQQPALVRGVLPLDRAHAAVQHLVVSTLLVCYDVHATKNENEIALELLQAAWQVLRGRHPVYNADRKWYFRNARHVVQVLTQVSLKVVEMALASLPLQSRITLEALAKEYEREQGGGFDAQSALWLSAEDDRAHGGAWAAATALQLRGDVLNPLQVVQYACVAVAEALWLGLGVDLVHWLLQRHVAAQQATDAPVGGAAARAASPRRGSAARGAARGTAGSAGVAAASPRHSRRHPSPLKAAALQQLSGERPASPSVAHGPAPDDAFLLRLPAEPTAADGDEDDADGGGAPQASLRTLVTTLPVAAQAAALLMLLQQPQDFARLVVGVHMLRQAGPGFR
eukprot:gene4428-3163_t